MAPSSLLSAVARQSTSSAGIPCPSGSALVCLRPSAASGLHSSSYTSSLRLCQAPPSLWLHLGPLSLRLHRSLPDPRLRLGRLSHLLRLGPPDPPHCPGSSALRLHLGLHLHLLRHRRSAPWSRQPFLHHISSLRWLHRGPPSWLRPGSRLVPPAPSPSCSLSGTSLRLIHPGLWLLSSSQVSVLRRSLHLSCLVTNPVYELSFTHQQRSPALHMDSHTTQTVTLYPGLHFPSSIALISPTAVTNHTPYISHGLPLSHCRVLFSIYHSSSDSYFTEPVPGLGHSS